MVQYLSELVDLGVQMTKWVGKEVTVYFGVANHLRGCLTREQEDAEWFKELKRLDVWKRKIKNAVNDGRDLTQRMVLLSRAPYLETGRTYWFEGVTIKPGEDKVDVWFNWGS